MKHIGRVGLIALVLLVVSTQTLFSQVILTPEVSGTAKFVRQETYRTWSSYYPHTTYSEYIWLIHDDLLAGGSVARWYTNQGWYYLFYTRIENHRGIIEFRTGPGHDFPADWMTTWNWTASLEGFQVTDSLSETGRIDLFRQQPHEADGMLTNNDYYSQGEFLTTLCENIPPTGTYLDPVDVTEILRENLFWTEQPDYTGFVVNRDDGLPVNLTDPHIKFTKIGGPPFTPTPTNTPKPSQPTPTPEPGPNFRLNLNLNRTVFSPGDPFHLVVTVEKPDGNAYYRQPLFVLLDVYGEYYFYPSWNPWFDYKLVDITTFIESIPILNFEWPNGSGSANGIAFHAAILNTALTSIAGNTDTVVFGWTDGY